MCATKMGQKRTELKNFHATHHEPMRQISPQRRQELRDYNGIRQKLLVLCDNKSELSGTPGTFGIEGALEIHHITGRVGPKLTNPFNMVVLTRAEHFVCQDTMSWEHKQELLKFIKPIRIAQGFKEEDYA